MKLKDYQAFVLILILENRSSMASKLYALRYIINLINKENE